MQLMALCVATCGAPVVRLSGAAWRARAGEGKFGTSQSRGSLSSCHSSHLMFPAEITVRPHGQHALGACDGGCKSHNTQCQSADHDCEQ